MFGQLKVDKCKYGRPKLQYKDVVKRDLYKAKVDHIKLENEAADKQA